MKALLLILALVVVQTAFAQSEIDTLKMQVRELQKKVGGNNLKLGVDFRTAADQLTYKKASGKELKTDNFLSNRLWINMGYQHSKNLVFRGRLSYYKGYGDTGNHNQRNGSGFADFDWVINENPYDNQVRVKEAYFLYLSDGLFGWAQLPWNLSIGRRPSTNGFLANLREGYDEAQSPLAHSINVEFDGLSMNFKLDKLTTIPGMSFKICTGRGVQNATSRFTMSGDGADYVQEQNKSKANDLIGFIFTPYNNGQYDLKTQFYKAKNLIGMDQSTVAYMMGNTSFSNNGLQDFGDITGGTVSFQVNGIGNMINDYLEGVKVFGSYAFSETDPRKDMAMLGSTKKEKGHSYWAGINLPGLFKDGEIFGFEWNKGSKYWRNFTYGEDTLIGSKLAARGTAFEAYYTLPLIGKALSAQVRYTKIKYDYTGSQGFFGTGGTPSSMEQAQAAGMDPVKEAEGIRFNIRYMF